MSPKWWRRKQKAPWLPHQLAYQEPSMTFSLTDANGDKLFIAPSHNEVEPGVSFRGVMTETGEMSAVDVPLSRLEDVIAGIRDAGRQANPTTDTAAAPTVPARRTPGAPS